MSPELEVLVAGLELQPVEGGDEDPAGDEADQGGGRQDHQDHRALYSTVQYKFSLLWGEAQLCLPYDCLKKKIP